MRNTQQIVVVLIVVAVGVAAWWGFTRIPGFLPNPSATTGQTSSPVSIDASSLSTSSSQSTITGTANTAATVQVAILGYKTETATWAVLASGTAPVTGGRWSFSSPTGGYTPAWYRVEVSAIDAAGGTIATATGMLIVSAKATSPR